MVSVLSNQDNCPLKQTETNKQNPHKNKQTNTQQQIQFY